MARKRKRRGNAQIELPMESFQEASLAVETRRRYLNYALSVITSRALPDVRDGLKPVQRRILYTMFAELHLRHDGRYRKSAAVVGDVMGKFHPHGDTAIYDALARMAQNFSLRAPLVDGRGNFGSPDGDRPAAMRYTEAKLRKLSQQLLEELSKDTVPFRPNYDSTKEEPVVLPARFPNLLVNGSQGIAVGMATSIPPHNLGEVIDACVALIDEPDLSLRQILRKIKGPDFPTGGELLADKAALVSLYESGSGSLKLRAQWTVETPDKGNPLIVVSSIPYAIERGKIIEKIADVIIARKLPTLLDVRDESTEECRVVCEFKKGADPQMIMAYLFKRTPLQSNVQVNLTCLVPTENQDVAAPKRIDLSSMLRYFLEFRMQVTTRRLQFDLNKLLARIHILEAFVIIFDALDETIRLIRRSDGRKDASAKMMKRFELDVIQVDAILDLRLYKLAKLEILVIREELETKKKEARRIERLLNSDSARWKMIRAELLEFRHEFADPRRTRILANANDPEFDADDFIVDEDAMVILSAQGWVKRMQRVRDIGAMRVRDGDHVLDVVAGSTRALVAFFSTTGSCYVCHVVDIGATTGYGVPIQTHFKMADGERILSVMSFDPRFNEVPAPTDEADEPEAPLAVAVTRLGMSLRFSLRGHRDASTRNGRKYCRLKAGDEVVYVGRVEEGDSLGCATKQGRALICDAEEVALLASAGRGVILIKLNEDDHVLGAAVLGDDRDELLVKRQGGSDYKISTRKYGVVSRAGKGYPMFKRGEVERVVWQEPTIPGFPTPGA